MVRVGSGCIGYTKKLLIRSTLAQIWPRYAHDLCKLHHLLLCVSQHNLRILPDREPPDRESTLTNNGITAHDSVRVHEFKQDLIEIQEIMELYNNVETEEGKFNRKELKMLEFTTLEELADVTLLIAIYFKIKALSQVVDRHITIDSFTDVQCLDPFRFRSCSQLHHLYEGLRSLPCLSSTIAVPSLENTSSLLVFIAYQDQILLEIQAGKLYSAG